MNSKNLILGTLAGGVTFFVVGFLLYGLALESFFSSNMGSATGLMKDPINFPLLALGDLVSGLLLTYIFLQWAGIKTFMTGAKAGALIGLLIGLSYNLISLATANMHTMNSMLVDSLVQLVMGGLAGGVIGWVLGYFDRATA